MTTPMKTTFMIDSGVDLHLMAHSDVVILTYGTFGDSAAILGTDKKEIIFPYGHILHNQTGLNMLTIPRLTPIYWQLY